ncbi:hypothetical protein DER44DRAFT_766808 [Fusarium oxysporum]|nr:hypothetical protein DER44DRAFT_766808 [Fusarium oxysporum]
MCITFRLCITCIGSFCSCIDAGIRQTFHQQASIKLSLIQTLSGLSLEALQLSPLSIPAATPPYPTAAAESPPRRPLRAL